MTTTDTDRAEADVDAVDRPQGAFAQSDGSVLWRVWAPKASSVGLVTWPGGERREVAMTARDHGYFEHVEDGVEEELRYAYRLDGGDERPDPATRWQPDGVHRPSAVFDPGAFDWTDHAWHGIDRHELVIYELHVGTFTPEGTFTAVIERLPELLELGVTAIEIMPVSQFPGERNWGYDGVHPYAAQNSYGGPHGLQALVDAAHGQGMAVLLDVVYNHLGPEGNYLAEFGDYFADRYHTPWGSAVNYDGPGSDHVRRYVVENAVAWARDFHLDGLRLDAVQTIYDFGQRHVLADIAEGVHDEALRQGRRVHVIAETNQNDVRIVTPPERGGYGLDGMWTDDFHHALHSQLTGEGEGYFRDFVHLEELAKSFRDTFAFDGRYSPFNRRRHGTPVGEVDRSRFVVCLKNHDQVGNRALGDRFAPLVSDEALRFACAMWAIQPATPLLFMGSEYAETKPFPFFCSFGDPDLVEAVRQGRRREFAELEFDWGEIPDPQDPATFESAKLSWSWPEGSREARTRQLVKDLLHARRDWPALRDRLHANARIVDVPGEGGPARILVLERGMESALVAWANPTPDRVSPPEPLRPNRELLLSTAEPRYGGTRDVAAEIEKLEPYELMLFGRSGWWRP